jgi:serine/threonine protein phosphatase 1
MQREIVLTDIHGCYLSMKALLEEQVKIEKEDRLYFLGDYINKGPDSKKVLDYIQQLIQQGYFVKNLMGNHEDLLLKVLNNEIDYSNFLDKGGKSTLDSFGVREVSAIPSMYLDFLKNLEYFIELQDTLLVHAGFDFSSPEPFREYDSMLNIREFGWNSDKTGNRRIIHGHVPTPLTDIVHQFSTKNQLLDLDGGCVYPHRAGMGNLLALDLTSWKLFIQPCLDQIDNS